MESVRARTNRSLRAERADSDKVQVDAKAAETVADGVVAKARSEADEVLVAAREKADQSAPAEASDQTQVVRDRAKADSVVEVQRSVADDRLRHRRESEREALLHLLPLERQHTDRDLLSERLRSDEAVESRDDFLAIVTNDLRNLLRGVAFSAMSLSSGKVETEEGQAIVATGLRIQHYVARMNRLIGDLMDVMAIDAGKMSCTITPGDPKLLIAETLATFLESATHKGLKLESEVKGTLLFAAFDHDRISQVFAHLVANAIKFTPQGGRVWVGGEREGPWIHFSVSDTGAGIPEKTLESVFLRFWQSAGNDPRGSGLGLFICKSIVEAHGGRIWAESKVGKGSAFHFTIPVAVLA